MQLRLLYLEEGPTLYAGYGLNDSVARWDGQGWHPYQPAEPRKDGWAVRLSPREAERCFPGSTTALRPEWLPDQMDVDIRCHGLRPELFDSYDFPNDRKSPDEIREYAEQILPDTLRQLRARRKLQEGEG
jgi:hypothetical protein